MQLHKTKYSHLSTVELIDFADNHLESLPPLGQELLYRLETIRLRQKDPEAQTKEFLERQLTLV